MDADRVRWTPYGRAAADALRLAVASAKGGEPLRPVTVVVSSNHVGVAARRLLASGRLGPVAGRGTGVAAVSFVTPYRLAELLGAASLAGDGRRPVSTAVIAAAVRAALAGAPGLFSPVAAHPATEAALVEAYRELRDVSAAALAAVATRSDRAAEVVRIHRAVREQLAPRWYDEQDLVAAAVTELAEGRSGGDPLGALVVHLPQRLTMHSGWLLRAAGEERDLVVIAGTTGDDRADGEVVTSLRRMGIVDASPSPRVASAVVTGERTRFITASDADDEVRSAVRRVVEAVRSGVRLDRIAILHASPRPYARLVREHLAAAGIASNGAAVAPLTASVAGRSLLRLLAMPSSGFRRQDVFTWMTAAPVLHDGRWAPTTAWERLSRNAGVVGGRREWDELLTTLAHHRADRAEKARTDHEEDPWRVERDRKEAERALELRAFVLGLIDDAERITARPRPWSELAAWACARLVGTLGPAERRRTWPELERKAAERVEAAIERLGTLDDVEGAVGVDVFARTLELELEADLGRAGRFGDGVLVAPVAMGVGLDLDVVVVLGLAEGLFPATVSDDSLLPDHERDAAGGELVLRRQRVDREHRELLAALAGASEHVLCVPRGDLRRSTEHVASRWALELASSLAGSRWWSKDLLTATEPWVEHVPSFDAGLRRLSFPATGQEHRLRTLMAAGPGPLDPSTLGSTGDPVLASGVELLGARRSDAFTRFDGHLTGSAIPSPTDRATSATALQRWAECPFAYLLHDLLRVDPVDNPEDQLTITPLDLGSLVHSALERFLLEVLARPAADQPAPADRWTPADEERLAAIAAEECEGYERRGRTGRAIYWEREKLRIGRQLQRFLHLDEQYRAKHGTRPVAAELSFGFAGEGPPVPFGLPDGRQVRFRGKVDRIDVGENGTIHVVDYKTGKSTNYVKLSDVDPDQRGTRLQLPVYGLAARLQQGLPHAPVDARYWFLTSEGGTKRLGYLVTDDVLTAVSASLRTIVDGIEHGVFSPHPEEKVNTGPKVACAYCEPDALGVSDLRQQWERKRFDPVLAAYADFAEPLEPAEMADCGAGDPAGAPRGHDGA